ncbi:MAG: hypothetical protein Q4P28_02250 [Tissierellia bacterium]|nr:hypothetical protein [Tissierellia bacterium]
MRIYLAYGNLNMVINTEGAYIEKLTLDHRKVLEDRHEIMIDGLKKQRGGCHICCPNFGPDEKTFMQQHGFAREISWNVLASDEDMVILKTRGIQEYRDLEMYLLYQTGNRSFRMSLTLDNKSEKELPVAPGFHPYFHTKNKEFNHFGEKYSENELTRTVFVPGSNFSFSTSEFQICVKSTTIGQIALWSDFKGDYICVEPTYNGPCFTRKGNDAKILGPGEKLKMETEFIIYERDGEDHC